MLSWLRVSQEGVMPYRCREAVVAPIPMLILASCGVVFRCALNLPRIVCTWCWYDISPMTCNCHDLTKG